MPTNKKNLNKAKKEKVTSAEPKIKNTHDQKEENVFPKITKIIMQLSVAIVALVVIFSPNNAWVLGPIIGSLAIMGIALGYFASK